MEGAATVPPSSRTIWPGSSSSEQFPSRSASCATRGSVMSILISHPGRLESGQIGHVRRLAVERAGERRHALRVRLGVKGDGDAVVAATEARQLEQKVTCGLPLTHCT